MTFPTDRKVGRIFESSWLCHRIPVCSALQSFLPGGSAYRPSPSKTIVFLYAHWEYWVTPRRGFEPGRGDVIGSLSWARGKRLIAPPHLGSQSPRLYSPTENFWTSSLLVFLCTDPAKHPASHGPPPLCSICFAHLNSMLYFPGI